MPGQELRRVPVFRKRKMYGLRPKGQAEKQDTDADDDKVRREKNHA